MRSLDLYSEPYGSTGNIGENFRRLLGAPALDPLQTVIRETVQNTSDAARLGQGPEILIRLRTLAAAQREALRSIAIRELPREDSSRKVLKRSLERPDLAVLEICDFRTVGLGGPTRSDRIPVETVGTDFIDFLRNIGIPRDTAHGGGTYGFGKVALYRASRCSSIIVDSLPHDGGTEDRRLIGCHVGRSFGIPVDGMMQRFTGRHWWGAANPRDQVADPLTGQQAAELADALGFPERGEHGTGTSIMILDFDTDEEDLPAAGNRIVETLLWNFWPRMMRDVPQSRRFLCKVEVEGIRIPVPAPEEHPPFDLLSKAMRAARAREGNDVREVRSLRPARFLGTAALEQGLRAPRRPLVGNDSLVPPLLHHIALMRPVELVVKYLEGNPFPDERLEWAGVFVASSEDEVERAFAESEPPAHDDWIPDNLPKGRTKTFVNVALKRLRAIAAEMGMSAPGKSNGKGSGPPLARLAGKLGAILEDVGGDGAGPRRPASPGGRGTRPRLARARQPIFERLEQSPDGRIAVFTTQVIQDRGRSGKTLAASASVAIEGTGLGRIEEGIPQPEVLSLRSSDGRLSAQGATIPLRGTEGSFEVRVLVPDDCAVTVDAQVLSETTS